MSKPKYKQGKQIGSVADFEKSECLYFKVKFGNKIQTKHRAFLISWQYRTLKRGEALLLMSEIIKANMK